MTRRQRRDWDKFVKALERDITGTQRDITETQKDITGTQRDITGTQIDITGTQRDVTGTQRDITETQRRGSKMFKQLITKLDTEKNQCIREKNGSREYGKGNKTVPGKLATTHTEDGHKQNT
jgi:septal ring factor EnvC (AmiA/AmiB activator)